MSRNAIEAEGTVSEARLANLFLVNVVVNGRMRKVLATLALHIKDTHLVRGDRVVLELSPHSPDRGRIIRRL